MRRHEEDNRMNELPSKNSVTVLGTVWLRRRSLASRTIQSHTMISLPLMLATACGFPKPADITPDATGSCSRDDECGGTTPFCVDNVCAVCKTSMSCPGIRPVCDMTSHECRTCVKDSECDS